MHYFVLERPPQQVNEKEKERSQGEQAKPTLYSEPEHTTQIREPQGVESTSLTFSRHHRELQQRVLSGSLPLPITQNSSEHKEGSQQQEKTKEQIPIYSSPVKNKKTNMIQKQMQLKERETEELSCSHTMESPLQEGSDDTSAQWQTSSSLPPVLPPKPGQKMKPKEESTRENENSYDSMYAEASSKPLQLVSQMKTDQLSDHARTATVLDDISPFRHHTHNFPRKPEHFHRSSSTVDHKKRSIAHSQRPIRIDHSQPYDTTLSVLESKNGGNANARNAA